jgi:hypothetical protein
MDVNQYRSKVFRVMQQSAVGPLFVKIDDDRVVFGDAETQLPYLKIPMDSFEKLTPEQIVNMLGDSK